MTSKTIDKENSTTFSSLSGPKTFGLANTKSFVNNQIKNEKLNSTPVISSERKALISNVKELVNTSGKPRRALCDVLNTTSSRHKSNIGITPTKKVESTSSETKVTKSFSKLKINDIQQIQCAKKDGQEEEFPPAERFIGSKYDNFDDLFGDGRLSEFLLAPSNTVFTTSLNNRGFYFGADIEEKIMINENEDENDLFEMEMKKVRKSLKKMEKKIELKTMDMECLDDLMPKIWEDSFEEH